jgi:hypothetical protein
MYHDASWLLKSVIADANAIQMPTQGVLLHPMHAVVGVSRWVAKTVLIWQAEE